MPSIRSLLFNFFLFLFTFSLTCVANAANMPSPSTSASFRTLNFQLVDVATGKTVATYGSLDACIQAGTGLKSSWGTNTACNSFLTTNSEPASPWSKIAFEHDDFFLSTWYVVRYGMDGYWAQRTLNGAVGCRNDFFGIDPIYGVVKECDLWIGDSAPPNDPSSLIPAVNLAAIPAPQPGYSSDRISSTDELPSWSPIGAFRTICGFSHMSFDDPIAAPGKPGVSHLHVFFGNTGTNAYSNTASLANTGNSTCRGGTANRTAYWVPAIIDTTNGSPVNPDDIIVYYKTGYDGVQAEDIRPIPAGLRMLAGDPAATGDSDLPWHFGCDGGSYNNQKYIPDCTTGSGHNLFANVNFPQCWDGVNLDSPDHKSHMAYANSSIPGCPATHPVALPEISYLLYYAIPTGTVLSNWRVSSDNYAGRGGYSFHADWFGGWKRDVIESFTANCMNARKDCASHLVGDGRALY